MKTIKEECEELYSIIKNAQIKLAGFRAVCEHKKTFEDNYEYRVGAIFKATICNDCGEVIKNLDFGEAQPRDWLNYPHKQLELFEDEDNKSEGKSSS